MAQALTIVRHPVNDFTAWRKVYDEVQPLRDKHGVKADEVYQSPSDANDVTVLHWFPSADAAEAFSSDPGLKEAMGRAGVSGAPRIEIVTEA